MGLFDNNGWDDSAEDNSSSNSILTPGLTIAELKAQKLNKATDAKKAAAGQTVELSPFEVNRSKENGWHDADTPWTNQYLEEGNEEKTNRLRISDPSGQYADAPETDAGPLFKSSMITKDNWAANVPANPQAAQDLRDNPLTPDNQALYDNAMRQNDAAGDLFIQRPEGFKEKYGRPAGQLFNEKTQSLQDYLVASGDAVLKQGTAAPGYDPSGAPLLDTSGGANSSLDDPGFFKRAYRIGASVPAAASKLVGMFARTPQNVLDVLDIDDQSIYEAGGENGFVAAKMFLGMLDNVSKGSNDFADYIYDDRAITGAAKTVLNGVSDDNFLGGVLDAAVNDPAVIPELIGNSLPQMYAFASKLALAGPATFSNTMDVSKGMIDDFTKHNKRPPDAIERAKIVGLGVLVTAIDTAASKYFVGGKSGQKVIDKLVGAAGELGLKIGEKTLAKLAGAGATGSKVATAVGTGAKTVAPVVKAVSKPATGAVTEGVQEGSQSFGEQLGARQDSSVFSDESMNQVKVEAGLGALAGGGMSTGATVAEARAEKKQKAFATKVADVLQKKADQKNEAIISKFDTEEKFDNYEASAQKVVDDEDSTEDAVKDAQRAIDRSQSRRKDILALHEKNVSESIQEATDEAVVAGAEMEVDVQGDAKNVTFTKVQKSKGRIKAKVKIEGVDGPAINVEIKDGQAVEVGTDNVVFSMKDNLRTRANELYDEKTELDDTKNQETEDTDTPKNYDPTHTIDDTKNFTAVKSTEKVKVKNLKDHDEVALVDNNEQAVNGKQHVVMTATVDMNQANPVVHTQDGNEYEVDTNGNIEIDGSTYSMMSTDNMIEFADQDAMNNDQEGVFVDNKNLQDDIDETANIGSKQGVIDPNKKPKKTEDKKGSKPKTKYSKKKSKIYYDKTIDGKGSETDRLKQENAKLAKGKDKDSKKSKKQITENNKRLEELKIEKEQNKVQADKLKTALGKATSFFSFTKNTNGRGIKARLTNAFNEAIEDVEGNPINNESYIVVASNEPQKGSDKTSTEVFVENAIKEGGRVFYFINDGANTASADVINKLKNGEFGHIFYRQPDGSYSTNVPVEAKISSNTDSVLTANEEKLGKIKYNEESDTTRDLFHEMVKDRIEDGYLHSTQRRRKDDTLVDNDLERQYGHIEIKSKTLEEEDTKGFKKAKSPLYSILNLFQLGSALDTKQLDGDIDTLSEKSDITASDVIGLRGAIINFIDKGMSIIDFTDADKTGGPFNSLFNEYEMEDGSLVKSLDPKIMELGLVLGIATLVQSKNKALDDIRNNEEGYATKSPFTFQTLKDFAEAGAWGHTLASAIGKSIRQELGIVVKSNDSSDFNNEVLTARLDAELGAAIVTNMLEIGIIKQTKVDMNRKNQKGTVEKGNFYDIAEDYEHLISGSNKMSSLMTAANKVIVPFDEMVDAIDASSSKIPNKFGFSYSGGSFVGNLQSVETETEYVIDDTLQPFLETIGHKIGVSMGYKTEAEIERMNVNEQDKARSDNDAIEREITGAKVFAEEIGDDVFHTSTDAQTQGRVRHNTKEYNIQNRKLHRMLSTFGKFIGISSKNKKMQIRMEDTLLFWMGVGIDKENPDDTGVFADALFHKGKPLDNKQALAIKEINEAVAAAERLRTGDEKPLDIETMNNFAAKHEGVATVSALLHLQKYRAWVNGGMSGSFRTNIITEQDGRTNGLYFNMLQFPDDSFFGDNPSNNLYGMTGINTGGVWPVQETRMRNGQSDTYTVVDKISREELFGKGGAFEKAGFEQSTIEFLDNVLGRDAVKELVMPGTYGSGEKSLNTGLAEYIYSAMVSNIEIAQEHDIGSDAYNAEAEKIFNVFIDILGEAKSDATLVNLLKGTSSSTEAKMKELINYDFGNGLDYKKNLNKYLQDKMTKPYVGVFRKFYAPMFKAQDYMKSGAGIQYAGLEILDESDGRVRWLSKELNSVRANDKNYKRMLEEEMRTYLPSIEGFSVDTKKKGKKGTPLARLQEILKANGIRKLDKTMLPLIDTLETERKDKTNVPEVRRYFTKLDGTSSHLDVRVRGRMMEDGSRGAPVTPIQSLDSATMFITALIVAEKTGKPFNFTSVFDALMTDLSDTDVVALAYNEASLLVSQHVNLSQNMMDEVQAKYDNAIDIINGDKTTEVYNDKGDIVIPEMNAKELGKLQEYADKLKTWLDNQDNVEYNNKIKQNRVEIFGNIQSIHQLGSYERGTETGVWKNDYFTGTTGIFQYPDRKSLGAVVKTDIEVKTSNLKLEETKKLVNPKTGMLDNSQKIAMPVLLDYLQAFHPTAQATVSLVAMSQLEGVQEMFNDIEVELNSIVDFNKDTHATGEITVKDGKGSVLIDTARNEFFEKIDYSTVLLHEVLHPVIDEIYKKNPRAFESTFEALSEIAGGAGLDAFFDEYGVTNEVIEKNDHVRARVDLLMKHISSDPETQKEAVVMMMGEPTIRRAFFDLIGKAEKKNRTGSKNASFFRGVMNDLKGIFDRIKNALIGKLFKGDVNAKGEAQFTMSDAYMTMLDDAETAVNDFEKRYKANPQEKILVNAEGYNQWEGTALDPANRVAKTFVKVLIDMGVNFYDKAAIAMTNDKNFLSNKTKQLLGSSLHDNWIMGIGASSGSIKRMDNELNNKMSKASTAFQEKALTMAEQVESMIKSFLGKYGADFDKRAHTALLDTDMQAVFDAHPELLYEIHSGKSTPRELADQLMSQLPLDKNAKMHVERLAHYMVTYETKLNANDTGNVILNAENMNKNLDLKLSNEQVKDLDSAISLMAFAETEGSVETIQEMTVGDMEELLSFAKSTFDKGKEIFDARTIDDKADQSYRRIKGWTPMQTEKDIEIVYAKSEDEKFEMLRDPQQEWEVAEDYGKNGAIMVRENLAPRRVEGHLPSQTESMMGFGSEMNMSPKSAQKVRQGSNMLPLYDKNGKIVMYRHVMTRESREKFLGMSNDASKGIAQMESTAIRRKGARDFVTDFKNMITNVTDNGTDALSQLIESTEDTIPLMLNISDKNFAKLPKAVRQMYKSIEDTSLLPKGLANYTSKKGNKKTHLTHVYAPAYDQVIGFHEFGKDFSRTMMKVARMIKGFVRSFKNNLVVKSIGVITINVMAGIHLLMLAGVPFLPYTNENGDKFPGAIRIISDSILNARKMRDIRNEMNRIEYRLDGIKGKPGFEARADKLKKRHDALRAEFAANPLADVMDRQFFQSMTGELQTMENDTNHFENFIFDLIGEIGTQVDKSKIAGEVKRLIMNTATAGTVGLAGKIAGALGSIKVKGNNSKAFEKIGKDIEDMIKRNKGKPLEQIAEMYGREGSIVYREGAFAMQLGDFIGRSAVYQWEVFKNTEPGMTKAETETVKNKAEAKAQVYYVDYRNNLPRNVHLLSSILPVMPFAKFFLNIQPVLYNVMLENPLQFMSSAYMATFGIPGVSEYMPGGINMLDTSIAFGFGGRVDPTPDLMAMAMTPPAYIGELYEAVAYPFG